MKETERMHRAALIQADARQQQNKPSLELYPPVTMPTWPPTWEDLQRLSLHYPGVYHTVTLIERGDCTREQGLIWLTFALANAFQKLFSAEVERRALDIMPRMDQAVFAQAHGLADLHLDEVCAKDLSRCEGRYPAPMKRDEPFEVTYRCMLQEGHRGPCGNGQPESAGAVDPAVRESTP